jgi:hypothetical protein
MTFIEVPFVDTSPTSYFSEHDNHYITNNMNNINNTNNMNNMNNDNIIPIIYFTIYPHNVDTEEIFFNALFNNLREQNIYLTIEEKLSLQYESKHIYRYCRNVDRTVHLDEVQFTFLLYLTPSTSDPTQHIFEVDLAYIKNEYSYPPLRANPRLQ